VGQFTTNYGKKSGIGKGRPPVETRFMAGNPGRPRGIKNRATAFAEALSDDDAGQIVKAIIKKARRGDLTAAKLVLDRLWPCQKGHTIEFALPPTDDANGAMQAHKTLLQLLAGGTLTADEAEAVSGLLTTQLRAIETAEIEQRLCALEVASHEQKQNL
jgi:hypothetical protein